MRGGAAIWGCCDGWRLCSLTSIHLAPCWAGLSLNLPLMMRAEQGLLGVCVCVCARMVAPSFQAHSEIIMHKNGKIIRANWTT